MLNPQASFKLSICFNDSNEPYTYEAPALEKSSVKSLSLNSKSTTTGKVIWFTEDDFAERLKADYRVEPDLPVRDFIGEFYGLASSSKRKAVLDKASLNGEIKTIGNLFNEKSIKKSTVRSLYHGMREETEPFSDRGVKNTLGSIGEECMRHALINALRLQIDGDQCYQLIEQVKRIVDMARDTGRALELRDLFVYYADGGVVKTDEKTVPFYFEMVAVPTDWEKKDDHWEAPSVDLTFGINQSFLYSNPNLSLSVNTGGKERGYYGFEQALSDLGYCFKVVCNLTCPNVDYQDKGKQQFDTKPFKPVFEDVLGKTIRKLKREVIPALNKINEDPEPEAPELEGVAPSGFIKDFVFDNFMDVYNEATDNGRYTLTQRQFFYPMRDRFMDEAKRQGYEYSCQSSYDNPINLTLNYGTFKGLVNDYEVNELKERIIYKDDRGFFVEPHSERRINLGTSSVENYQPDLDQYNSLLFVEKTGFYELLHNDFKLSKKYDVGIINAKGYSNNAARDLVEKIQAVKPDIKLYTLTDFDIKGLGIARNAMEPDELSAVDIFACERLGVTLEDIKVYGLPVEPVDYKKSLLTELENSYNDGYITTEEYEFLRQGQRVEINAFTPVRLKDYLETKFEEYGIRKLAPKNKDEVETFRAEDVNTVRRRAISQAVGDYLNEQVGGKMEKYLREKIRLEAAGEKAQNQLEVLTDNQQQTLFDEILDELKKLPPKNWKKINEEKIKQKREEAEEIKREYQNAIKKEARRHLGEINIDVALP